jgi:hypothetical protein
MLSIISSGTRWCCCSTVPIREPPLLISMWKKHINACICNINKSEGEFSLYLSVWYLRISSVKADPDPLLALYSRSNRFWFDTIGTFSFRLPFRLLRDLYSDLRTRIQETSSLWWSSDKIVSWWASTAWSKARDRLIIRLVPSEPFIVWIITWLYVLYSIQSLLKFFTKPPQIFAVVIMQY